MSKRIVLSIMSAAAMSVGGWFVSCGSPPERERSPVAVSLPQGCVLVAPRDEMSSLTGAIASAAVKPGKNEFVIACDGRMIQVDKTIAEGQKTVGFTLEELR